MTICNSVKHDEIVYEKIYCPLCEAISRIYILEETIADMESNQ